MTIKNSSVTKTGKFYDFRIKKYFDPQENKCVCDLIIVNY